jgi:hypothetical protein
MRGTQDSLYCHCTRFAVRPAEYLWLLDALQQELRPMSAPKRQAHQPWSPKPSSPMPDAQSLKAEP